jgi:protein transport protein SEC61 subunit alpha
MEILGMLSRFHQVIRKVIALIPGINKPTNEISMTTRMKWTLFALIIYSIMASIPIMGTKGGGGDPFALIRTVTASTHRSLTEVGVGAIVTANLIVHVLVGLKVFDVNLEDSKEKSLCFRLQKLISLVLTILIPILLLVEGIYGFNLDPIIQLIIVAQLFCAGVIIIYLDEILRKGWGFGSGVLLFIAVGVGFQIFQGLFGIQAISEGPTDTPVLSMRGIAFAFLTWATQRDPIEAIGALFFRYSPSENVNLPSLSLLSVIATIVVFLIVIYLESIHFQIPIIQDNDSPSNYLVKLIPFPIIPLIFTSVVFANLYFIALMVWNASGQHPLALFLGTFTEDPSSQQYVPQSGLVYFLTPPQSLVGDYGVITFLDPLGSFVRALIYAAVFLVLNMSFSKLSLSTTGVKAYDIMIKAPELGTYDLNQSQDVKNAIVLEKYLNKIAVTSGFLIGLLAVTADCFGVLGTGVGLLLLISIFQLYKEMLKGKEIYIFY